MSPGHTLVVPRRLVATWFEATAEERTALFELVDEVKRLLDERLHPDGYIIGVNAGEAAGQTVMHLHVQYEGVADEPTGEELERLKRLYLQRFPDGREREAQPDIAYFRVSPIWIRYSDFRQTPPNIVVSQDFSSSVLAAARQPRSSAS